MNMQTINQHGPKPGVRSMPPVAKRQEKNAPFQPSGLSGVLLKVLKGGWKLAKPQSEPRMKVVEQLCLSGKRHLSIVAIDGRDYVIGGSSDSITAIAPLPTHVGEQPALQIDGRRAGTMRW